MSLNRLTSLPGSISLEEINRLRKFGNKILKCKSIEDVARGLFSEIEEKVNPQVSSLFLFSKNGLIERFMIHGVDKQLKTIENDWLKNESYLPGESFSGKAAIPPAEEPDSPYGEPYLCNDLENYDKYSRKGDLKYGDEYIEKLGFLKCGISVPLNGVNRTFGTIEILNKLNKETGNPDPELTFSDEEICWLTIIGSHISSAISRLRNIDENKIYAKISHMLADPQDENIPPEEAYKFVTDKLINNLTPYKVCILRLLENDTLFFVEESHTSDISMRDKGYAPRSLGEGIVGSVAQRGTPQVVDYTKDNDNQFMSAAWIEESKLKRCLCFPLVIQKKVVGTLTLFTAYKHELSEIDREFLENVSYLLAAYRVGVQRAGEVKKQRVYSTKLYDKPKGDRNTPTNTEKVIACLQNQKYDFRTIKGISAETGVSETEVEHILNNSRLIRKSLVTDSSGNAIYTLRRKPIKLLELLALAQQILSKPFLFFTRSWGENYTNIENNN